MRDRDRNHIADRAMSRLKLAHTSSATLGEEWYEILQESNRRMPRPTGRPLDAAAKLEFNQKKRQLEPEIKEERRTKSESPAISLMQKLRTIVLGA